ncbi:hypothetical protein ACFQU2_37225 [Siccirubricoccus deserti]
MVRLLLAALLIGAAVADLSLLSGFGWRGTVLAAGATLGALASLQILETCSRRFGGGCACAGRATHTARGSGGGPCWAAPRPPDRSCCRAWRQLWPRPTR